MNKIKTKNIYMFLIGSAFILIAISIVGIFLWRTNQNTVNARRYHVFCELIKPGMTHDEVREVLSKIGTFRERESQFQGFYRVIVNFIDPATDRRYGGNIILTFIDGRYQGAEIAVPIGETKSVCNGNQ